ncbi:Rne/Rng family ribonuclease [Actinomadura flavalba]|uniref:Rne/Rng family ribonuclease n=1 Tax=Actinomadura flavalba TaxID=1120938 RepID=UPI0005274664|nr:Rne/Rng family ribonuclease [Actinomadura flavalba]
MLENEAESATESSEDATATAAAPGGGAVVRTPRRRASRPAGPPPDVDDAAGAPAPDEDAARAAKPARTRATRSRKAAPAAGSDGAEEAAAESAGEAAAPPPVVTSTPRARSRKRPAGPPPEPAETSAAPEAAAEPAEPAEAPAKRSRSRRKTAAPAEPEAPAADTPGEDDAAVPAATFQPPMVVFQPPQPTAAPPRRERPAPAPAAEPEETDDAADDDTDDESGDRPARRRRRRGGRGRGRAARDGDTDDYGDEDDAEQGSRQAKKEPAEAKKESGKDAKSKQPKAKEAKEPAKESAKDKADRAADDDADDEGTGSRRRRRRRRRSGGEDGTVQDDPPNTVTHVRDARAVEDEVQSVRGSTRLEAKKQRRREGREQGRRRPPVITEAEFLARRESVERQMVVRQQGERTQIAVLEDGVLVEHYVNRATHQSYVGNVYLGKVQNVLPSMEAAFVDIGKGRNAVLYAGEVNWDASGLVGQPRRIEVALKSGQSVLVQVTKDPLGHKGARLTSQISLPGRYLVYVPDGSMTGISRKLPDKERSRLKQILKKIMPENAGVIVRTAAEGATEEELTRDVTRLSAQWENIRKQVKTASAPSLLHGEPDLTVRVIRDIFNEDFTKLVVSGDEAWDTVADYVHYVAPHLEDRVERWDGDTDAFAAFRVEEQIAKALERKVWLPSGGSLVIDRTEAMTVIDVNTGKFTGQGGNLEETVTRNNLEAAEEIVRQLRLRDIGGIIVVDFIDMVLESNRDLVLRRLVECLSRDRTKHQVAEVTSLGLVQMTRKRVGQGLLEAFSETCDCCNGRGVHVQLTPVESAEKPAAKEGNGRKRKRKGDVEKAVEEKVSRQGRAGRNGDGPDPDSDEAAPQQAVVDAEEAVAESSGTAPGTLTADEPVPADLNGSGADTAEEPAPRRRRSRRPAKPKAGADAAETEQAATADQVAVE